MNLKIALVAMLLSISQVFAQNVDLEKSVVNWKGTKIGKEHFGKAKLKSGNVKMEGEALKSAEFVVDLDSITVDDLTVPAERDMFLGHMKSGDFFEVSKYPTAKFVTTKVDGSKVTGDLTIKGKTHPVSFAYGKEKGENGAYTGDITFDRTKFDMVYGSGNFFKNLGDKIIHDEVKLNFKVYLKEEKKK